MIYYFQSPHCLTAWCRDGTDALKSTIVMEISLKSSKRTYILNTFASKLQVESWEMSAPGADEGEPPLASFRPLRRYLRN